MTQTTAKVITIATQSMSRNKGGTRGGWLEGGETFALVDVGGFGLWPLAVLSILGRGRFYFAGKNELILEVESLRFVHSKPTVEKLLPALARPPEKAPTRL